MVEGLKIPDAIVSLEDVSRSSGAEPFDVVSIYSFAAGKVERVESVR